MPNLLQWTKPNKEPRAVILFAHGAGAGPESEFMKAFRSAFVEHGYVVACLTFPYWQKVLETGKKRPPDKAVKLDAAFQDAAQNVKETYPELPLVVMGKSMGARVAYRCASDVNAQARVGLGFPFHPPGKQEKNRLGELTALTMPSLIVQGSRDPFGNAEVVLEWEKSNLVLQGLELRWVEAGNHDLMQPKRIEENLRISWKGIVDNIVDWLERIE